MKRQPFDYRGRIPLNWRRWRWGVLALALALLWGWGVPVWSHGGDGLRVVQVVQVQTAQDFDRQGRDFFAAGQWVNAAQAFEQAAIAYARQNDPLRQGLALSNLSLAQQQLGNWEAAATAIAQSLTLLSDNARNSRDRTSAYAQSLDIRAGLQLAQGQPEAALTTWQQAAGLYQSLGDRARLVDNQINQTQALQALGLYRRAIALLLEINQSLATATDSPTRVLALRNLGDALRVTGDFDPASPEGTALEQLLATTEPTSIPTNPNLAQSSRVLTLALAVAERIQQPEAIALTYLSLGNTARLGAPTQDVLRFYQEAANNAGTTATRIQALVNRLGVLVERQQFNEAQNSLPQVETLLQTLPPGRVAIYARIQLAQSVVRLSSGRANRQALTQAARWLAEAEQQATQLGDQRAIAYTQGLLGEVYEQTGQLAEARKLTEQALRRAQSIRAAEIAYRWQWQLGRVLKRQWEQSGRQSEEVLEEAIASYRAAVRTIQSLRTDLAAINPEIQFAFRNEVEPIHRQLVELLLSKRQPELKEARDVIESLQLAELDNFFRVACLTAREELVDQVDEKAAVIYPILLPDRLAIIVSLPLQDPAPDNCSVVAPTEQATPNRLLCYYTPAQAVGRSQIEAVASVLQRGLKQGNTLQALTLPRLKQMYDWLIRPEAAALQASRVETLVFVLDGALRNLPMAALHDGERFLVEGYSLALTPGLQLRSPRPLAGDRLRALVGGLSEASQGFPALPNVPQEIQQVETSIPGSRVLLNDTFTTTSFQSELTALPFTVVHLATHGKFSSVLENTFILTENGRLNVNQLSDLLRTADLTQRSSLELLVLSACETAEGDDRAALGLAGIAVRAGAKSTIATLWQVNDASTAEFMQQFYEELTTANLPQSKAEALRQAQLTILRDAKYRQEPYYWAPYVLVGNWL